MALAETGVSMLDLSTLLEAYMRARSRYPSFNATSTGANATLIPARDNPSRLAGR